MEIDYREHTCNEEAIVIELTDRAEDEVARFSCLNCGKIIVIYKEDYDETTK